MSRSLRQFAAASCALLMLVQALAPVLHATLYHGHDTHGRAIAVSVPSIGAPGHCGHDASDCFLWQFLAEGRAAAVASAPTTAERFILVDISIPPPVAAAPSVEVPRAIGCRAPPPSV